MAKKRLSLGESFKESINQFKDIYHEYEQSLDETEEIDEKLDTSKKTFDEKFKDFAKKHKKLSFGLLALVALGPEIGWDAYRFVRDVNFANETMQQVEMMNKIDSQVEIVTERPTVDENGHVVTQKDKEQEKEGITIESGDFIFSQNENGEYTLKEKGEENSFKQELQEDVKKEEDLTQEELEQRAKETQEKAEVTPEIDKTLE